MFVANERAVKFNGKWFQPGEEIKGEDDKPLSAKEKEQLEGQGLGIEEVTTKEVEVLTAKNKGIDKVLADFDKTAQELKKLTDQRNKAAEQAPADTASDKAKQNHQEKLAKLDEKIAPLQALYDAQKPLIETLTGMGEPTPPLPEGEPIESQVGGSENATS